VTVRHLRHQALAAPAATIVSRHVRLGPGFIEKNQALDGKPAELFTPGSAALLHVRPILLCSPQDFF
jgi:hypothetical protein